MVKALFPLGEIAVTPCAYDLMKNFNLNWIWFIARHQTGDWGDISNDDQRVNHQSVSNGSRILSAYDVAPVDEMNTHRQLWVLTEADRSFTTILLPEEY
ncbi:hypothetical protein [Dechloromonas sp. A34]|uniref:hypothetical protein n=1 Tax=Dechloromonas sp. A34 TaxID=447588 RepID=UPI0022491299|nr:hypothetical protein [Dechloromonas sp. A34]